QMNELHATLEQIRSQLADSHAEAESLRREVRALHQRLAAIEANLLTAKPVSPAAAPIPVPALTTAELADEQRLLAAKINDQCQTKVESGSKYHLRLSGMALLNAFTTRGIVDNIDLPETARPRQPGDTAGSTGATMRQSTV